MFALLVGVSAPTSFDVYLKAQRVAGLLMSNSESKWKHIARGVCKINRGIIPNLLLREGTEVEVIEENA